MKVALKETIEVIAREHEQMPKVCPKCGGPMFFEMQYLQTEPKVGDVLIYRCMKCGERVEKFFEFPEWYKEWLLGGKYGSKT
jgi:DNA-directed RNA polymerase subunit RPC12/RpoP